MTLWSCFLSCILRTTSSALAIEQAWSHSSLNLHNYFMSISHTLHHMSKHCYFDMLSLAYVIANPSLFVYQLYAASYTASCFRLHHSHDGKWTPGAGVDPHSTCSSFLTMHHQLEIWPKPLHNKCWVDLSASGTCLCKLTVLSVTWEYGPC